MALLNVLFDSPKKLKIQGPREDGTERELLILDMSNEISHGNEAEPTDNPVEDGVDVTDHVDIKPKTLSFRGIMSEAPISIGQAVVGNVAGAVGAVTGGAIGGIGGSIVAASVSALGGLLLNGQGNRVLDAHNTMLDIMERKVLVTIITGLRAYNNMVLTSYNPVENTANGESLVFTASFRELRVVKSEQVILPDRVLSPDIAAGAASVQKQGSKAASGATDAVSGSSASVLSRITGIGA